VTATVSTCLESSSNSDCLIADSIQLVADLETVRYGLRLLQNGQVLRFLGAQIAQMGLLTYGVVTSSV